jgi:hypothetical protein
MTPGDMTDELLDPLSLLVVQIGDGLAGLVLEFGEQSADVLDGMVPLLGLRERQRVGLGEGLQTLQEAGYQVGGDLGLNQHLLQPHFVSAFHDRFPP